MKRNNLIYTGLVSCLLMATTACSDYLDINQNPEYPTEASSSTLLPSGIAGVASIVGGTYELYGSMWSQQCTQGHHTNQYNHLVNYTITNAPILVCALYIIHSTARLGFGYQKL